MGRGGERQGKAVGKGSRERMGRGEGWAGYGGRGWAWGGVVLGGSGRDEAGRAGMGQSGVGSEDGGTGSCGSTNMETKDMGGRLDEAHKGRIYRHAHRDDLSIKIHI